MILNSRNPGLRPLLAVTPRQEQAEGIPVELEYADALPDLIVSPSLDYARQFHPQWEARFSVSAGAWRDSVQGPRW